MISLDPYLLLLAVAVGATVLWAWVRHRRRQVSAPTVKQTPTPESVARSLTEENLNSDIVSQPNTATCTVGDQPIPPASFDTTGNQIIESSVMPIEMGEISNFSSPTVGADTISPPDPGIDHVSTADDSQFEEAVVAVPIPDTLDDQPEQLPSRSQEQASTGEGVLTHASPIEPALPISGTTEPNIEEIASADAVSEIPKTLHPEKSPSIELPEIPLHAPNYQPPRPAIPAAKLRHAPVRPRQNKSSDIQQRDFGIRVRVQFKRPGPRAVISLVPEYREGMLAELIVAETLGEQLFTQMQEEFYAELNPKNLSQVLRDGVDMRGRDLDHRHFRWVLGGRELYVLAPDGECGLSGYISTPRLLLGEEHVVLVSSARDTDVRSALDAAGCAMPETWDDGMSGVPPGWMLFRRVRPTCSIPPSQGTDLFNALCPLADVEPHFSGGIRLERRIWLLGHPPCIYFTGNLHGVEIRLDDQPVIYGDNGTITTPGWDAEGDHQLWYGGQTISYSLHRAEETWEAWPAHELDSGAALCGAKVHFQGEEKQYYIRIPRGHIAVLGAQPGEVAVFHTATGWAGQEYSASVRFSPVWALPEKPLRAIKSSAWVNLIGEPLPCANTPLAISRKSKSGVRRWCKLINAARRKGLAPDPEFIDLWRGYCACAQRLRKACR